MELHETHFFTATLFAVIMGASTFSVLTSILVLYFHHHGAERRPPKIVRFFTFEIFARLLCMRGHILSVRNGPEEKDKNGKETDRKIIVNFIYSKCLQ